MTVSDVIANLQSQLSDVEMKIVGAFTALGKEAYSKVSSNNRVFSDQYLPAAEEVFPQGQGHRRKSISESEWPAMSQER